MDDQARIRALPWAIAHVALNNFFYIWTFGGSIFILFLSELGLPKDQIGLLLSLFPFAGLLALGAGGWVARLGRKRTYLMGYGLRKPIMAALLLLPWLIQVARIEAGLALLAIVLTTVAVLRALAETAYYPWLQEFVPNAVRGKFSGINTILTTLTSLIALWIASRVIAHGAGLMGYMILIGAGSAIGLLAVGLMGFVPGGAPIASAEESPAPFKVLKSTLQDQNFTAFLAGMGSYSVGVFMLSSFLPLYLKEQIGLQPGVVVTLDMVGMFGAAAASLLAGFLTDRIGSRPVLMPGLALSAPIPLGWLLLSQRTPQAVWFCGLLYFLFGAFSSLASIAAIRLLFNAVIPREKNTEYTAIFYAWSGLTGGATPLTAGWLLTALLGWQLAAGPIVIHAYHILFLLSLAGFASSIVLYGKVRPDAALTTRAALSKLFRR